MPRRILKKITPHPTKLQNRWFLKVFGSRMTDPRLWSLQRRYVTAAFAVGLAICFIPLPIHLPLAALIAMAARINVPTIIGTVLLVNPFTAVPVYYTAYRVGCATLGVAPQRFSFRFDFDWLQYGLGPMWRPFLLGCLICGVLAALVGWLGLEALWRASVRARYRARRSASTP
jgi:uncharacterized protein (DUF2062 family)